MSSGQVGTTAVAAAGVGGVVVPGMVTNATLHWLTFPLKTKYFAHDHYTTDLSLFFCIPATKGGVEVSFYQPLVLVLSSPSLHADETVGRNGRHWLVSPLPVSNS